MYPQCIIGVCRPKFPSSKMTNWGDRLHFINLWTTPVKKLLDPAVMKCAHSKVTQAFISVCVCVWCVCIGQFVSMVIGDSALMYSAIHQGRGMRYKRGEAWREEEGGIVFPPHGWKRQHSSAIIVSPPQPPSPYLLVKIYWSLLIGQGC